MYKRINSVNKMPDLYTFFDTETTNLLKPEGNSLPVQPRIIDIYAAQVDVAGNFVQELDTLVNPQIPIENSKIHGITDQDVQSAPIFAGIFRNLTRLFFQSHTIVGCNLNFDQMMLIYELRRIGKEHHFPYPPIKFCTIEQSMHLKGYRLKNSELYRLATGKELIGAHRAKPDALATNINYRWLKSGLKPKIEGG